MGIGLTVLIGLLGPLVATISCGDHECAPTLPPTGPDGTPVTDTFYFVHQPLTGDGGITVHLASLTGLYPTRGSRPAGQGALAGMAQGHPAVGQGRRHRHTGHDAGSAYAAVLGTGGHGVRMRYDYTHDIAGSATAQWSRLDRSGDTLTGYDSTDGTHWTEIGATTLPDLPKTVQIGLFATSPQHSVVTQSFGGSTTRGGPSTGTARFTDIDVRGGSGTWTGTAVGGNRPALATGYVDGAGGVTVTGSGDIAPALAGEGTFAIEQSGVMYPQVDGDYTPVSGYFPLSPWAGFAVLCGYAVAALALAAVLLRRRDA